MGVKGLLPMLKSVMDEIHIAKYRGKTVGIDAAGWLYRGCYSCSRDVVSGKDTDEYLNYCLQQIKLLQEHDITPIFVFDGAPLPAKAELNASRNRTRMMWKNKALRAAKEGEVESASVFNKAVSVSNAMIMKFIEVLRRMAITFYVAPYEADAQLAYMSRQKIVDVVISEDSDCIPYGARTVLFKWNGDGWASELKRRSLGANEDLSFVGWTEEMFIQLCVLCGCDYCPSVPGVGIITAYKLVNVHQNPRKVIAALKDQKGSQVDDAYAERFYWAVLTFRHHLVFDPRDERLKMLNPLGASDGLIEMVDKELRFLGDLELKDDVAISIARGLIHPSTHESYAWQKTAATEMKDDHEESFTRSMTSSETSSNIGFDQIPVRARGSWNSKSTIDKMANRSVEKTHHLRQQIRDESVKPPSTSWRHLDSVLGSSPHILNFRSPKVSENFRSLVSLETPEPNSISAEKSSVQLKQFENRPVRQSLKRVRNPQNRIRDGESSGFSGEVSCRVDASTDLESLRVSQRPRLSASSVDANGHTKSAPSLHLHSHHQELQQDTMSAFRGATSPFASHTISKEHHPRQDAIPSSFIGRFSYASHVPSPGGDKEAGTQKPLISVPVSDMRGYDVSSSSRATYAEEKWDRILEAEIASSESEDNPTSPHHSSPTRSDHSVPVPPSLPAEVQNSRGPNLSVFR